MGVLELILAFIAGAFVGSSFVSVTWEKRAREAIASRDRFEAIAEKAIALNDEAVASINQLIADAEGDSTGASRMQGVQPVAVDRATEYVVEPHGS